MIILTAKSIGKLINRRPKYVYILMRRLGIKLNDENIETVVDLIARYRYRNFRVVSPKTGQETKRAYARGCSRKSALKMMDRMYKPLYDQCRERDGYRCRYCQVEDQKDSRHHIHHVDFNHYNMTLDNLMLLCGDCHIGLHRFAFSKLSDGHDNLESFYVSAKAHVLSKKS